MTEITANVYDGAAPTSLITELPDSKNREWSRTVNEIGAGSLRIHWDDPDATSEALTYGNIIRLGLDDSDVAAFIIEKKNISLANKDEKAGLWWTLSGRGPLALLEGARVDPDGTTEGSDVRQRTFDFTSTDYDDSSWIAATQIRQQSSAPSVPTGWPDPPAWWIWSRATTGSPPVHPAGISYFRKGFTLADRTELAFFFAADNIGLGFVDNVQIFDSSDQPHSYQYTYRVDRTLDAGDHVIAAKVTNGVTAAGHANPGGLLFAVYTINPDTGAPDTLLFHSDDSWLALDYPASVPGMTTGRILRILLEEAQARGDLAGVTWDFTDDDDSNGQPWADEPDQALDIGTKLLDVVRTFTEQYMDVDMTATLVLRAFNKATSGSDLTGTVNLQVGVDFEEFNSDGEDHLTNAFLVRDGAGRLTIREDATSLAGGRRKEDYLEIALAPNPERAQAMTDQILVEFAYPTVQVTGKVTKASGPYSVWREGDMVLMPGQNGEPAPTNVVTLGFSEEDDAGHPSFPFEAMQDDPDASS